MYEYEASIMDSWFIIGLHLTNLSYAFARRRRVTYAHIANVNAPEFRHDLAHAQTVFTRLFFPLTQKKRAGVRGYICKSIAA